MLDLFMEEMGLVGLAMGDVVLVGEDGTPFVE